MTKISSCNCRNDGQDVLHGVGMRVFNQVNKHSTPNNLTIAVRCTVCGTVKLVTK